jgi:hypothetical protein
MIVFSVGFYFVMKYDWEDAAVLTPVRLPAILPPDSKGRGAHVSMTFLLPVSKQLYQPGLVRPVVPLEKFQGKTVLTRGTVTLISLTIARRSSFVMKDTALWGSEVAIGNVEVGNPACLESILRLALFYET